MGKNVFGSGEFGSDGRLPARVDPGAIRPLAVAGETLPNNLVVAPMAGVSNLPFRLIAREAGASLAFTETVSAKGLVNGGAKSRRLLETSPREVPVAFQLFGAEPEFLAEACRQVAGDGAVWIDLNLGCPVKKFIRNGAGSALLRDPARVAKIVRAMRGAFRGVLSVKMRSGWDDQSINAPEVARLAVAEGADLLSVHGRTRAQQYTGRSDRDVIRRVVEEVPGTPVLANGDITQPADVFDVLSETGAAGVMIGRGAMGNPWIFAETLALARGGEAERPSQGERWDTVQRHIDLMRGCFDDDVALANNLKKYVVAYAKGLPGSARFRRDVVETDALGVLLERTRHFFSGAQAAA